jgi:hypothetical protein
MKVNGRDDIPYMKWKIKVMFETTNQPFILWDILGRLVKIILGGIKEPVFGACLNSWFHSAKHGVNHEMEKK